MRMSDWSSDVCSSDLHGGWCRGGGGDQGRRLWAGRAGGDAASGGRGLPPFLRRDLGRGGGVDAAAGGRVAVGAARRRNGGPDRGADAAEIGRAAGWDRGGKYV